MGPARKRKAVITSGIADTGVVVTDLSLRPIAFDHGVLSILGDINEPEGENPAVSVIPKQISEAVDGHILNGSGIRVALKGAEASYRCIIYKVERLDSSSAAEPMLALHFQRGLAPEDAIDYTASLCNLTDREVEVLRGLSRGLTSKEIALRMEISPNTVKSYIRLIMVKIGVTTRSGIVGKLLEFIAH
jgi:DNA-binding CsgD family transcriptional regulator